MSVERNAHRVSVYRFKQDLRKLIKEHGMDKTSNVPDHILADFIISQIMAIGKFQDTLDLWRKLTK